MTKWDTFDFTKWINKHKIALINKHKIANSQNCRNSTCAKEMWWKILLCFSHKMILHSQKNWIMVHTQNCHLPSQNVCRKDVRLPIQLQRAMAAEAEAAREARAKVIFPCQCSFCNFYNFLCKLLRCKLRFFFSVNSLSNFHNFYASSGDCSWGRAEGKSSLEGGENNAFFFKTDHPLKYLERVADN